MLRKTIIALLAAAPMAMFAPDAASARSGGGGGHMGGGHLGGGMGGGMHGGGGPHFSGGGGFHHDGFRHDGFHHRFGSIGLGFYGPYYDGDYGYPSYVDEGDDGCYLVRRRVHTRYGWRLRRVQICQ
jgi:hypothetical protein